MQLSDDFLMEKQCQILQIRRFDERACKMVKHGTISGTVHEVLKKRDYRKLAIYLRFIDQTESCRVRLQPTSSFMPDFSRFEPAAPTAFAMLAGSSSDVRVV